MDWCSLPTYAFQIDFKEPASTIVLFGRANVDYEKSMKLLKRNDLRPLTYKEALVNISQDNCLLEQLKGKWFYIDDNADGHKLVNHYFFNKRGKLTHGEKPDIERNVYAWFGSAPLTVIVNSDADAIESGRRFTFDASLPKNYVAPIVLGIMPRSKVMMLDVGLTEAKASTHGQEAIKKAFRS